MKLDSIERSRIANIMTDLAKRSFPGNDNRIFHTKAFDCCYCELGSQWYKDGLYFCDDHMKVRMAIDVVEEELDALEKDVFLSLQLTKAENERVYGYSLGDRLTDEQIGELLKEGKFNNV